MFQTSILPFIVRHTSSYGPYISKEAIKVPGTRCLFCSYRDKNEFDLSLHMLEKHKLNLLHVKISYRDHANLRQSDPFARFYGRIEYRLEKVVEIAKRRSQVIEVIFVGADNL